MKRIHYKPGRSRPVVGIALMSIAMLIIPIVDGLAKYLSTDYSPLFISWCRYAAASLVVLPIAFARFGPRVFPTTQLGAHTLRTVFLMAAMTLYFLAISSIPLATAATAYFVGPIIATVIAVIFYGEAFTARKTIALILGAIGVLFILRPGIAFEPAVLLATGSGFFFALYMVSTRVAAQYEDPLKTLTFQCVVGALILLPQALLTWSTPSLNAMMLLIVMAVVSVISHGMSITAFRFTETTTLAPLVYLELVGAIIVGFILFREFPELSVWLGVAAIVGGGLLLIKQPSSMPTN